MTERMKQFVREKPYLFWYIKNPTEVSDRVLVEQILNYGDWHDFKLLESEMGREHLAQVFWDSSSLQRHNYRSRTKNFFTLYFNHAANT